MRKTPHRARWARAVLLTGVAAGVAALTACGADGGATAPAEPTVALKLSKAEAAELKAWVEREEARVKQEKENGKELHKALDAEWKALKKEFKKGNPNFLYCDPKAYDATVKIVGPEGAELKFGDHVLRIPAGALSSYTVITAEAPTTLAVEARFSPHGTTFAKPPILSLSYKHCNVPTDEREGVAYVNGEDTILETPVSSDRGVESAVDAMIWHFSRYVVTKRSGTYAVSWKMTR
jgi:hypothetical protein